jgi:4a-hydroxytetrahydrobiopterin dehydratase
MALTPSEIEQRLDELPGWQLNGQQIEKRYRFSSYRAGVAFAVQVALLAEKMDHHPDLQIGYQEVRVVYSTHSAGGVTERDLEAAHQVERILQER